MATRVTVKSTKVKRGTNDKGEWVNTQIDTEEGSKWTTFHKGASDLKDGDVIEVTEYEEGSGNQRNKITKYEKISSAPPKAVSESAPASSSSKSMYDDPVIRRKSIEDQARAYMITDLIKAGIVDVENVLALKLMDWLMELGVNKPVVENKPAGTGEAKPVSKDTTTAINTGHFENAGQFFAACYQKFGLAQSVVFTELAVNKAADIKDLDKAWNTILENHTGAPF